MSDAFSYKKGMRLPSRIVTLAGNGLTTLAALDANSIKFVYRTSPAGTRVVLPTTIVGDPSLMQVEVDFGSVDTSVIAQYQWQIEATLGSLAMSFPEKGFYTFSVTDTI